MTKINEIKQKITELKAKAREISENPNSTLEAIKDINNKLSVEMEKLKCEEILAKTTPTQNNAVKVEASKTTDYKKAFLNAIRNKATIEDRNSIQAFNKLSSYSDEDGGYLIPVDQRTKINELRKERFNFRDYVNIEKVSTLTGTRVFEKTADALPFVELTEGNEIQDVETPKFTTISYNVKSYAGILPMPNQLLQDADSSLESYLNKWLARKLNATDNNLVLTEINKITNRINVSTIDDLKTIRNTKLNMAFKPTTKFFMNSDAFNYFALQKDGNGRSLLEYDPKNPTQRMIDGCQVVEIPNDILKTTDNKCLVIIGDLKETFTIFDRQQISIMSTTIGGEAWKKNQTEIRAILREDIQKIDERALVLAEVDISTPVKGKK